MGCGAAALLWMCPVREMVGSGKRGGRSCCCECVRCLSAGDRTFECLHQCDDNKERQTALTYIIVVVHALEVQIPDMYVYMYLEWTVCAREL